MCETFKGVEWQDLTIYFVLNRETTTLTKSHNHQITFGDKYCGDKGGKPTPVLEAITIFYMAYIDFICVWDDKCPPRH